MNKKVIISIVLMIVVGGGIFAWSKKHQQEKADASVRYAQLVPEVTASRDALIAEYQKRYERMIAWKKASGGALNPNLEKPFSGTLTNEADLASFDQYQNEITNELSNLLASEHAQKSRPKDLEKIEESINRTRAKYHEHAFEENHLIQKFDLGKTDAPIFPAEKMIQTKH
jgi:flagellar basal body-associated protein FliL